eukprot:9500851-Pyramimonas_sp.AAC.1
MCAVKESRQLTRIITTDTIGRNSQVLCVYHGYPFNSPHAEVPRWTGSNFFGVEALCEWEASLRVPHKFILNIGEEFRRTQLDVVHCNTHIRPPGGTMSHIHWEGGRDGTLWTRLGKSSPKLVWTNFNHARLSSSVLGSPTQGRVGTS